MSGTKADLLLHPIRLRIVTALSARQMTAKELAEAMPNVPQTTLYRHLNMLVKGKILRVAEETQIRGTIERTYALAVRPSLRSEDLRGMKKADYERVFLVYLSTLLGAAQRYLDSKGDDDVFDPIADGVELSLGQLLLSDKEYAAMNRQILDILMANADRPPAPNRKMRMFTYLSIPQ